MTKEELKLHIENRYSVCSKRAQGLSYGSFYDGYMDCYSEFEETNNELKGKLMLSDMVLTDKTKRIKELEDKLMDKVCLESLDIVSAKIKDLEKENAELKADNDARKFAMAMSEKVEKQLREDNAFYEKACEGATMMYKHLTKAKELLKDMIDTPVFIQMGGELYENEGYTELTAEVEQFLKE